MLVNAESFKLQKMYNIYIYRLLVTVSIEKHQYLPLEVLYEPRRPRERPGEAPLLSSPMSVTTPVLQPRYCVYCIRK